MQIKQLEIVGFKSFVDRTLLKFDHDVTGIVGPNGCGKSNIVDAIRWCMGEQSAKHLRGKAMTDVIFNGSETRGPHGLAEVSLTFDNTDPDGHTGLPLEYREYPEITVTRRLYRDGTSEYLLNKMQVRLKDITDLFLGTGVGTKAYSIIEQGKIGLIVSARPEDRRLLIEEAAGITKYKSRRKQAEQKMDQTRQNLARVGDILSEIERSAASLKRQADKAERYKAYRAELEDLLLHEASHAYLERHVVLQVETTALSEVAEGAVQAKTELSTREAELEAHRQRTYQLEEILEKAQKESYALSNEVRVLEGDVVRGRDRLTTLRERTDQVRQELSDLHGQEEALEHERDSIRESLHEAESEERDQSDMVLDAQERWAETVEEERKADRALAELRARATEAITRVASAEAKLTTFARRVNELQTRRERLVFEADTVRSERADHDSRRQELAIALGELTETRDRAQTEKAEFESELKTSRDKLTIDEKVLQQEKNELSQRRNRLRALEEVTGRLEGVGAGVKSLLATKDPVLRGLVADHVQAPHEHVAALAGALGERLQAVVVDDLDRAVQLLTQLGESKKGRAIVVSRRAPYVAGSPAWVSDQGSLGWLVDLVEYSPQDEGLVRALLGGWLLVSDVSAGRRLIRLGCSCVTPEGTVIRPDGTVTGGSGDAVGAGILEQRREIRELDGWVSKRTVEVEAKEKAYEALKARVAELQQSLERARQEAHQAEIERLTTEKDLKRSEEQTFSLGRRVEAIEKELGDVEDALAEVADERAAAEQMMEDGREQEQQVRTALSTAESGVYELRERVAAQQAQVTEQKVKLARIKERSSAGRNTIERLNRSIEELALRVKRLREEMSESAKAMGLIAGIIFSARERHSEMVSQAREAERHLHDARKAFDEARSDLGNREAGLTDLRKLASTLGEKKSRHEMQVQRLKIEIEHILTGVSERFRGLDLRRVLGDYHRRGLVDDEHRERISELTGLIDRMGPVNLDALKEYEDAKKRQLFYAEQKDDLEKALADLEEAILQMDRESRRLFKETFESVNEKFQILFPRLFRGGQARLQLTQAEDLLEAGVDILAQPPGKKLGNIELMSGGEKALTAVSLIFAMFQHKPSPFCVLDEVDAPLDEANVARFNEAIRSMTHQAQFILITHIKRTMQSVDVLYGVTMQEPGVSKLVSVKVNDAAKPREAGEKVAVA